MACTEAAAPPARIRMTMSMAMFTLTALTIEKTKNSEKDKR
jgi:hypothetical protein